MAKKAIVWNPLVPEIRKKFWAEMRQRGAQPMRDVEDYDMNTVLTFWAVPHKGLVVTQMFANTGDVIFLKNVTSIDDCFEQERN